MARHVVVWLGMLGAACRPAPHADALQVFAHPYAGPYTSLADVASVRPSLTVTGASELQRGLAAKLAADGVGKAGHVQVELAMSPSHGLVVTIDAAWGTPAGKSTIHATITGALGESTSERLAAAIEKIVVPPTHVELPSAPAAPIAVAASAHMQCSLHDGGAVRCWGDAARLGPVPATIANTAGAIELAVGDALGCVRRADGTAACWNPATWSTLADELPASPHPVADFARLADGAGLGSDAAIAALDHPRTVAMAADGSACAITGADEVWCRVGHKPFARVVYQMPAMRSLVIASLVLASWGCKKKPEPSADPPPTGSAQVGHSSFKTHGGSATDPADGSGAASPPPIRPDAGE